MIRELNVRYSGPISGGMPISTLLRRAIDRLNKGWTKGDFYDGSGGACALGALADAAKGQTVDIREYRKAEHKLLNVLKDMHPELMARTIPELNDDPAVTFEDVLTAFEKTALMAEEGTL